MKKKIYILILALCCLVATDASAQLLSTSSYSTSVEVTQKEKRATVERKIRKNTISASYIGMCDVYLYNIEYNFSGLSLGYTRVIPFDRRGITFMDLGASVSYCGGFYEYFDSWAYDYQTGSASMLSATVPLNFGLCLRLGRLFSWTFYGGLSGNYYYSDDFDALYLGWQAGSRINVGLIGVGFEYGSSITDIFDGGSGQSMTVSLGFNF